jgi:hypothetical protein
MDLEETGSEGVDWIHLAQDRDQWRALVNTVMNLRVHNMLGISWVDEQLLASQEGFSCMELVKRISQSVSYLFNYSLGRFVSLLIC